MTNKPDNLNFTNSLELKALLDKNVSLMNLLIPKLKDYDAICENVFKKLNLDISDFNGSESYERSERSERSDGRSKERSDGRSERSKERLTVKYDLDTHIIAEKQDNVIVIQPQYFMDKDKSELEFILAHEVGHHRFPGWLKVAQLIPLAGYIGLSLKYLCTDKMAEAAKAATPNLLMTSIIMLSGVIFVSTVMSKRYEESWCDRFAAQHVGVQGGIKHFTFLNDKYQKLSWSQKLWNYDLAHPSLASRLKVLETLNLRDGTTNSL